MKYLLLFVAAAFFVLSLPFVLKGMYVEADHGILMATFLVVCYIAIQQEERHE